MKLVESEVGKILSEATTKKVILLIFTILMSFPFFDYNTYWASKYSFDTGLDILSENYNLP